MIESLWLATPAAAKITLVCLCWGIVLALVIKWLIHEGVKYLPTWIREVLLISVVLLGISVTNLYVQGVAVSSALASLKGK